MNNEFETERKKYKLTVDEVERIKKLLGRPPQSIEWALFSALWSEHCSYKSSKVHLKKFFSENNRVVQSSGENAGIVDLGEGEKIAFKIESHNHPSFIEPYQGAATGVGGILRDILTMGARPIALANYLCFGEPTAPRMPYLVDGVVRGIGDYGNCVGVPMVTGQTEFHSSYNQNILVNAMAVGYFGPNDPIVYAKAKGPGNYVVYVGAKTGGDGVHGASMASESFSAKDTDKRPTVQIGDPFFEKLLIEACLEVIQSGTVVAIQDMGAAGLTSSSFEMASRGGVGFELHLDKIPLRDSRMTPEQILLSESQERMLLICEPKNFENIRTMFHKWGLDADVIGTVLKERTMRLHWKGEVLTEIDPDILVENAPQYERPFEVLRSEFGKFPNEETSIQNLRSQDLKSAALKSLSSIENCSRSWIYEQFDQRVGTQTERDCSSAVGVVRLPSGRKLGIVLGGRPDIMRDNPYMAGLDCVAEPALQLAIRGFEPLALTDCLNFGNPENKRVMGEFVSALKGMNEMCRELSAPIISGNVSFYNETEGRSITSTPATGLVGLSTERNIPSDEFTSAGKKIFLVRANSDRLDARTIAQFLREVLELKSIEAGQVVGKAGLVQTLIRMSMKSVGCEVNFEAPWIAENKNYEFIACGTTKLAEELGRMKTMKFAELGTTGGSSFTVSGTSATSGPQNKLAISIAELKTEYEQGWRKNFESLA